MNEIYTVITCLAVSLGFGIRALVRFHRSEQFRLRQHRCLTQAIKALS